MVEMKMEYILLTKQTTE